MRWIAWTPVKVVAVAKPLATVTPLCVGLGQAADIARQVGSPGWLLVVWLVTGVLTLMAALSYGILLRFADKRYPEIES